MAAVTFEAKIRITPSRGGSMDTIVQINANTQHDAERLIRAQYAGSKVFFLTSPRRV